jgi:hypothetical protein
MEGIGGFLMWLSLAGVVASAQARKPFHCMGFLAMSALVSGFMAWYCDSPFYDGAPENAWGYAIWMCGSLICGLALLLGMVLSSLFERPKTQPQPQLQPLEDFIPVVWSKRRGGRGGRPKLND